MKKIYYSLVITMVVSVGVAQEFSTTFSKEFTKETKKDIYSIFFPSPYGFLTLHHLDNVMMDNTKTMVINSYDQSMEAVEKFEFNLPKLDNRASDLIKVIELENQLMFISQVMSKKEGKHQINAQIFSQKNMSVSNNNVLSSFPFEKYSKSGFYNVSISPDQNKIAILANMPFQKKTNEKVKIWVFNKHLNLEWEQTVTLPYDSERAYQEEVFVSNAGNVFLSKTTNAFKKTRKTEVIKFDGTSFDITPFSAEGFMPLEMTLTSINGKPMLIGFYWNAQKTVIKINSTDGDDNDGAFLFDLSKNTLVAKHKWSDNLKNKYNYKSLKVVDVKIIEDDIFLFGEKRLKRHEFRKTGGTMSTESDYFYTFGPSIMVNMDTKGTLKGFTPLFETKELKNYEKEKGSFTTLYLEDGLRVFSNNDHNKISMHSFYANNKVKFNPPKVLPYINNYWSQFPFLIPHTVRRVKDYGIVYFITNSGDRYWFNKMSW